MIVKFKSIFYNTTNEIQYEDGGEVGDMGRMVINNDDNNDWRSWKLNILEKIYTLMNLEA